MNGFKKALQEKNGKIQFGIAIGALVVMGILGLFHVDHWAAVTIPGIISLIATDRFVAMVNYFNNQ